MYRREFLKTLALTVPAGAAVPYFNRLAAQERGRVKITDVKVMRVRMKNHAMPLVKIETDAGVHGIGECHHDITGLGAKDAVLNAFRGMLIGQDPFDIDKLTTQMMWRVSYLGGNHGIAVHGVTGVEIALWDLTGKLLGMPVRKILSGGAFTDKVRAYWTNRPRNMLDPASCREWVDYIKGSVQKWTAAKVDLRSNRPGGSPLNRRMSNEELDINVQGFTNVREAVGTGFEIAVHCHWEFDFFDALRLARGMEKIRPWWLEDPMPPNYVDTWVKLTAASPVPILCGENLYTRNDFLPFLSQTRACTSSRSTSPRREAFLKPSELPIWLESSTFQWPPITSWGRSQRSPLRIARRPYRTLWGTRRSISRTATGQAKAT